MIKVIALFQKITCLILSRRELLHQLNYQQNQYTLFSPLRFSLRYKIINTWYFKIGYIWLFSSLRRTCLSCPAISLNIVLGGTKIETFSPLKFGPQHQRLFLYGVGVSERKYCSVSIRLLQVGRLINFLDKFLNFAKAGSRHAYYPKRWKNVGHRAGVSVTCDEANKVCFQDATVFLWTCYVKNKSH